MSDLNKKTVDVGLSRTVNGYLSHVAEAMRFRPGMLSQGMIKLAWSDSSQSRGACPSGSDLRIQRGGALRPVGQ